MYYYTVCGLGSMLLFGIHVLVIPYRCGLPSTLLLGIAYVDKAMAGMPGNKWPVHGKDHPEPHSI
jgi:hypothetical protein